jgi:hypothetical protein
MLIKKIWCWSILLNVLLISIVHADTEGSANVTAPTVTPEAPGIEQTPLPAAITSDKFPTLPDCLSPVCPTIGQPVNQATCPDYCKVDRVVNPTYPSVPIVSVTPAVCPMGYSQIAEYNMQPEIIYNTSAQAVYNIPTLAQLHNYEIAGYKCLPNGSPYLYDVCTAANTPPVPLNTDVIVNSTGYAGQYMSISNNDLCYYNPPANCVIQVAGSPKVGKVGCTPTSIYNTWWTATVQQYICTPPTANLYYTSNFAPASVVCRSNRLQWTP